MSPKNQSDANYYSNKDHDAFVRIGIRRVSHYFHLDTATVKWCYCRFLQLRCHYYFPSCDRTQSVYKKQKICRETCLKVRQSCYKPWKSIGIAVKLRHPNEEILNVFQCKLPSYRNAGDSPECWYDDLQTLHVKLYGAARAREIIRTNVMLLAARWPIALANRVGRVRKYKLSTGVNLLYLAF